MRRFGTQGPVHPSENYFVRRAEKINDFISRIKEGRYIVILRRVKWVKLPFCNRRLTNS